MTTETLSRAQANKELKCKFYNSNHVPSRTFATLQMLTFLSKLTNFHFHMSLQFFFIVNIFECLQ